MEITIEKGVPIPPKGNIENEYPWDEMEVSDSFKVTCKPGKILERLRQQIIVCSRKHIQSFPGKEFTTRLIKEDNAVRIWRTK
jgi:hypothetical protein